MIQIKPSFCCTLSLTGIILAGTLLSGCADDDNNSTPAMATYTVTVTNLTANQPLSPPAVVLHTGTYAGWAIGQAASSGLEVLAEGGDSTDFLAEAGLSSAVRGTASGAAIVAPGASDTFQVTGIASQDLRLTTATMLVNTNDAFTGVTGKAIGKLAVSDRLTFDILPYDAGTELNSETAGTIPGPAAGGTGYEVGGSDSNFVSIHGGVVTQADGLAGSALDESHRFMSPVGQIIITRTQ